LRRTASAAAAAANAPAARIQKLTMVYGELCNNGSGSAVLDVRGKVTAFPLAAFNGCSIPLQ
jgi:hypothetical protein